MVYALNTKNTDYAQRAERRRNMKHGKIHSRILIIISAVLFFSSCKKNDESGYLVGCGQVAGFSRELIQTALDASVQDYPELIAATGFVNDGVDVFKLVYNTEVGGNKVEASGLVAVPSTDGEYPVISFQNGTNTVNAECPSANPYGQYILLEFIASMGYVVVIPDYPGFGNSSDIPHPYLIAEPTIRSVEDMFRAAREAQDDKLPGIRLKNEFYLIGYSQGGWATMSLHRDIELNHSGEFSLKGSICGAGPYDMYNMMLGMSSLSVYPMPSYLCYIINAYSAYGQLTNKVSDILNEPYATKLPSLYTGTLTLSEINSQLTTSIPGLLKQEFIAGFATSAKYSSVRDALIRNSVEPYNTHVPLLLVHGSGDTHVNVSTTENLYTAMINAGTSASLCTKIIYPGLDHGDALVPCMADALEFIMNLRDN